MRYEKKRRVEGMKTISIKIDERMLLAIQNQAQLEFSSVSGICKKAVDRYLRENDIRWEEVPLQAKPQKTTSRRS